jgi:hypothetical protein
LPIRTTLVPLARKSIEIQQAQDARFDLHAALVVFEVEAIDGAAGMQARHAEPAFDGPIRARLQFEIGEHLQSRRETEIPGGDISDDLIELPAHGRQAQLIQFRLQRGHEFPFEDEE